MTLQVQVQVQVQGSGPALVLLHGWGMTAAVWRALGAELAADFCVHAVEMPCYGIAAHASCDTLAATVAALAADLPPRATVCGWSLGGQVALAWARARPFQVARLILLATTPRFVAADDWADGMADAEFADFAGEVAANLARARMRFLALQANGDGAAREVLRELRGAFDSGGEAAPPALAAGLQLLRENDLRAELELVGQPALVMHGVNDALIPCAAGAYLARMLPDAEFVLVDGAAHAVFVTREAMVARCIREFHG
jgi:pimeloyl-[acyl-carrier protein] methyl ester esterase